MKSKCFKTVIFLSLMLLAISRMQAATDVIPDSAEFIAVDSIIAPTPDVRELEPDSAALSPIKVDNPDYWRNRIKAGTYSLSDTTIVYPKFLGFCVKVYNWADRVFNTYDHEYVQPTGKKWKVLWRNSNWTDSYSLDMPDNFHVFMLSDVFMSMGPTVSFMAVGLTYHADINSLLSKKPLNQKRFDLSFSTALFEVDLFYTRNREGTNIRRFDPYDQGNVINVDFPSLQLESYGAMAYYFLNHGRYYHGAAYNYSKIQKRSQGSFIFGLNISHQYIEFDLSTLPADMVSFIPQEAPTHYLFSYNDFCLLAGYGFNWVFNPHWVMNISGLPSFGLKHCMSDNGDGRKNLPAINIAGRFGLAYNLKNYFVGLYGAVDAHWYLNKQYSFLNSVLTFGVATGLRF